MKAERSFSRDAGCKEFYETRTTVGLAEPSEDGQDIMLMLDQHAESSTSEFVTLCVRMSADEANELAKLLSSAAKYFREQSPLPLVPSGRIEDAEEVGRKAYECE